MIVKRPAKLASAAKNNSAAAGDANCVLIPISSVKSNLISSVLSDVVSPTGGRTPALASDFELDGDQCFDRVSVLSKKRQARVQPQAGNDQKRFVEQGSMHGQPQRLERGVHKNMIDSQRGKFCRFRRRKRKPNHLILNHLISKG